MEYIRKNQQTDILNVDLVRLKIYPDKDKRIFG